MSITERQRSHLTETATTVLGAEAADTLMALLPMDGWDNIVREPDLRAATAELRADMAEFCNEVRTDITEFKAETRERFSQVDVQFADMRRLIVETNTSTRNWMLTSMVTITSVVTAIQLLIQ